MTMLTAVCLQISVYIARTSEYKPQNTFDNCEQFVSGNAGSLKLSLKGSGVMCAKSLSKETRGAFKYIQRLSIKTKPKVTLTQKRDIIVLLG